MCEDLKPDTSVSPPASPEPVPLQICLPFPDLSLEAPPPPPTAERPVALEPVADDAAPTAFEDWKAALRHDFEGWLATIDTLDAQSDLGLEAQDDPDLYSFYEQLAVANAENRKANRRSAEAVSQWAETLAAFGNTLGPLREAVAELAASRPKPDQMSREHCLMLVELLDRLHRVAGAFQMSPPKGRSWWRGGREAVWRKAWDSQRRGFAILIAHLEDWLRRESVTRLDALGQPFDPATMMAVAVEPDASRPPRTVVEEVAAGYLWHGGLLRAAQVKVTRA